jgi:hypothetical protein
MCVINNQDTTLYLLVEMTGLTPYSLRRLCWHDKRDGMSIAFTKIGQHDQAVLERWLSILRIREKWPESDWVLKYFLFAGSTFADALGVRRRHKSLDYRLPLGQLSDVNIPCIIGQWSGLVTFP